ncbi:hypothetical protein EDM53_03995 [Rickettsiales endosymbiont of Peranema trichophorum]|uniref:hypothetical protein n=1 Tax=Rickettsiales endosymbiont of Peranema trichophorum TaxID=2486577 RepID=UPI00102381DD|nr:hypothetical protein [Rickettsiales endosymbiont of Peranema trichophorum]RZI46356.1 hypothetical protein EDM53_03995 [Rickettsiales endosymbiont of Peranema trichophorum]
MPVKEGRRGKGSSARRYGRTQNWVPVTPAEPISTPLLGLSGRELNVQQTRYDSLSTLFSVSDVCAAVMLDMPSKQMYIAMNGDVGTDNIAVKECLSYIRDICSLASKHYGDLQSHIESRPDDRPSDDFRIQMKSKVDAFANKSLETWKACIRKTRFERGAQYIEPESDDVTNKSVEIHRAVEKVTDSIILHYSRPEHVASFTNDMIEILESDDHVKLIGGAPRGSATRSVKEEHAELKLVDVIMSRVFVSILREETIERDLSYYIGVSKSCCLTCRIVIQAVNETLREELGVQNIVDVREPNPKIIVHEPFPAGIPEFLAEGGAQMIVNIKQKIKDKIVQKALGSGARIWDGVEEFENIFTVTSPVNIIPPALQVRKRSMSDPQLFKTTISTSGAGYSAGSHTTALFNRDQKEQNPGIGRT